MAGVSEASDLVRFGAAVLTVYRQALKEDLDWSNPQVLTDPDLLDAAQAAFEGLSDVPGELANLSWSEVVKLVSVVINQLY